MDLARLQTLRELSLRSTMSAVAEALHVSPSAVSQQIAQLEDEFEIELVERRGRGVRLTPAGRQLVAHVERLASVLEEARSDIARMRSVVAGELRVAAFPSIASTVIPQTVRGLSRSYPHLTVIFDELEAVDGLAALRSWQVDVAIIDDLTLGGRLPEAGIVTERLMADELLVMLPKGHRLAKRKSIAIEELREDSWALDVRGTYAQVIISACGRAGFKPFINGNCIGYPAILAMVEEGCSVSIMPSLRVRRNPGNFRSVRLEPPVTRTILTAFRAGTQRKPTVAAFRGALLQSVAAFKA